MLKEHKPRSFQSIFIQTTQNNNNNKFLKIDEYKLLKTFQIIVMCTKNREMVEFPYSFTEI